MIASAALAAALIAPGTGRAEFFWVQDLTVTGTYTAAGTIGGQAFTITSDQPITLITHYQATTFPSQYKVPSATALQESLGATYTLTFASPVENPSVSIASLGNSTTLKTFNFGAAVQIEYESHAPGTSFIYNNGSAASTTSIAANEGFVIARYNTTVSSVTFSVPPPGEFYMTLLVGFDVSADAANSTIDASPATVEPDGASSATVTVQAKDQFGNSFSKGGETVVLSTSHGTLSSVTDNADGTYTATLTATAEGTATITGTMNGTPMSDSATVEFDDTVAPTLAVTASSTTLKLGETATITFTFSEEPAGFADGDITTSGGTLGAIAVDGGDARIYTATFTPGTDYEGTFDVAVAAGSYTDAAGNLGGGGSIGGTADTAAPTVSFSAPATITSAFTVTATFSSSVTGLTSGEVQVTNGTLTGFSGAGADYSLDIDPVLGEQVTVRIPAGAAQDAAGNDNLVGSVILDTGSPATEFAKYKEEIEAIIRGNAATRLEQAGNLTRRQVREARTRFILDRNRQQDGATSALASRRVPLGGTGTFRADDDGVVGQAAFFGLEPLGEGRSRLVYGDFDAATRDDGASAVTVTGRVAWEWMRDDALLGAFIGLDAYHQDVAGSFEGSETGTALTFGGYGIGQLGDRTVGEAWLALYTGRSDLDLDNGTLALQGRYDTLGVLAGGGITGTWDMGGYELWPSITLGYARAYVGTARFTGTAFGLTESDLSAEPGDVERGELALALEYRRDLPGRLPGFGAARFSAEPRLLCVHVGGETDTQSCGAGLRLALAGDGRTGTGRSAASLDLTRIDDRLTTSMRLAFEHRF